MNSRLLLLLCLIGLFCSALQAQGYAIISGNINADEAFDIHVYRPVEGYSNVYEYEQSFERSLLPEKAQNKITQKIILSKPSFVYIKILSKRSKKGNRADILLFPGDSIHFECSPQMADGSWIRFTGSNAAGHNLFTQLDYDLTAKYTPLFALMDKLPGNKAVFLAEVNKTVRESIQPFADLVEKSMATKQFLSGIRDYYRISFYERVVYMLQRRYAKVEKIPRQDRLSLIKAVIGNFDPLQDSYTGIRGFLAYKRACYEYFILLNHSLDYAEDIYRSDIALNHQKGKIQINKDFVLFTKVKNKKEQEVIFANDLLMFMLYSFDEVCIAQIKSFSKLFPTSKWLPVVKHQEKRFNTTSEIAYVQQNPIEFADTARGADNLKELIMQEAKKPLLFVDLWASYCKPCIVAFQENYLVDSFFNRNNIQRLYISLDASAAPWKTAILKYKLGGLHYKATTKFVESLRKDLGLATNQPLMIPRYLIASADGRILDYDFAPPDELKFFDLWTQYLNGRKKAQ